MCGGHRFGRRVQRLLQLVFQRANTVRRGVFGEDAFARLQSDPMIVASPNSGAAASAVSLLVGSMIGGTIYRLQCWCATSDGQTLSLWTHLMCRTPN